MNLQSRIQESLWESIHTNYEKRNFTGAILDAIYFLSDLLRSKSGMEGDGVPLVGQALGGANPKIKLNKLQSESDWNVQKGFEQLLRGFYQAIRNPRSHGKVFDSEGDAQSLILFMSYVVGQIDSARSQFSGPDFLKRVVDVDFVPNERYAELLVQEIPAGKRMEVFVDVFNAKARWVVANTRVFLSALFKVLTPEELAEAHAIISDELKTADEEDIIRPILGAFDAPMWLLLDEAARLRIENKLIRSIKDGRYVTTEKRCRGGALGTWAARYLGNFSLRTEAFSAISHKLVAGVEEQDYVFEYLTSGLEGLSPTIPAWLCANVRQRLDDGDRRFYNLLMWRSWTDQENWTPALKASFERFHVKANADEMDDDIPF